MGRQCPTAPGGWWNISPVSTLAVAACRAIPAAHIFIVGMNLITGGLGATSRTASGRAGGGSASSSKTSRNPSCPVRVKLIWLFETMRNSPPSGSCSDRHRGERW